MFSFSKAKVAAGLIILLVLTGSIIGFIFLYKNTAAVSPNGDTSKLIDEISKIYDLPKDETPTVATVTDVSKLVSQPFFAKAKNGDKVLIYQNTKKAILYDPNAKRILEVAPINDGNIPTVDPVESPAAQISSSEPKPTSTPTPSAKSKITAKIALRNGAGRRGLAASVEEELKKTYPEINVVAKDNVDTGNLDKTIVVVIKKGFEKDAEELAKYFKTEVENLPKGETIPAGTEVMVILGRDRI